MRLLTSFSALIIPLLLLADHGFDKGIAWWYTMTGVVYDKATYDVLRNTSMMIGEQLVITDDAGHYTVIIRGVTCDSGSRSAIDRCNEEAYGTLVVRRLFSEANDTIHTHWKEFACIDPWIITPNCHLSKRDLYVP